jgi:hypothetical protein
MSTPATKKIVGMLIILNTWKMPPKGERPGDRKDADQPGFGASTPGRLARFNEHC